ncbi:hypothetical protein [Anaerosalibacter massiliensis]|jgi:archaellum component FlaC|uniref:hypothetical protein n=1 Tax=Anaerosalibacter massiliensis TaxID=1347392 RepID=UPI0005B27FF2|nr:hypothetical protein [Anaerosalibacter massiliensis]
MDKETLEAIRVLLKEELEPIKNDIKELKTGQEEIKELILELEPKNANRHLELKESIEELRQDLTNVEIITSSNWNEIAKLKKAK